MNEENICCVQGEDCDLLAFKVTRNNIHCASNQYANNMFMIQIYNHFLVQNCQKLRSDTATIIYILVKLSGSFFKHGSNSKQKNTVLHRTTDNEQQICKL